MSDALNQDGHTVKGFAADLSDPHSVEAVIKTVEDAMGPIDVCLYNATTMLPSTGELAHFSCGCG